MIKNKSLEFTKEQLTKKIQDLYETDTGDFKRKVALYLNRFYLSQKESSVKEQIENLKNAVLYRVLSSKNSMENIDDIRFFTLKELEKF